MAWWSLIGERLAVQADREIDAGGNLVSAPFIDPHLHLDAALSVGDPRYNESGTLLEGIAIWGERRPSLQKNEVLRNAREAVLWEVATGVQFIRTHADTTDSALVTVEALVELREEMKDVAEIQGGRLFRRTASSPSRRARRTFAALDMGDRVGAIPHIEFTREDGVRSVELAFELAEQYGRPGGYSLRETGDEQSRFVEVMAKLAIATGMGRCRHGEPYHGDAQLQQRLRAQADGDLPAGEDELHHRAVRQLRAPEPHGRLSPPQGAHAGGRTGRRGRQRLHRTRLHHGPLVPDGGGSGVRRA